MSIFVSHPVGFEFYFHAEQNELKTRLNKGSIYRVQLEVIGVALHTRWKSSDRRDRYFFWYLQLSFPCGCHIGASIHFSWDAIGSRPVFVTRPVAKYRVSTRSLLGLSHSFQPHVFGWSQEMGCLPLNSDRFQTSHTWRCIVISALGLFTGT